MICATLVNTQTHTQTTIPAVPLTQPAEAEIKDNFLFCMHVIEDITDEDSASADMKALSLAFDVYMHFGRFLIDSLLGNAGAWD